MENPLVDGVLKSKAKLVVIVSNDGDIIAKSLLSRGVAHIVVVKVGSVVTSLEAKIFTNAFYRSLLIQKMSILESFNAAYDKLVVEDPTIASKVIKGRDFQLLPTSSDSSSKSSSGSGSNRLNSFLSSVSGRNVNSSSSRNLSYHHNVFLFKDVPEGLMTDESVYAETILQEQPPFMVNRYANQMNE